MHRNDFASISTAFPEPTESSSVTPHITAQACSFLVIAPISSRPLRPEHLAVDLRILVSHIPVCSCPENGLFSFEENHSPSSSSSRTFREPQAIGRLHGDHGCRCEIHVER